MKLSRLTYEVVKNVKYLEDTGFTYIAFKEGEYDGDQDYANSINNAMTPINEAIHRLSDRNKIMYQIVCVNVPSDGIVDITRYSSSIKKIKAMFYLNNGKYKNVSYRELGRGFVLINNVLNLPLYIQYIEDIKNFEKDDIYNSETDVELSNVGISETMCSYIIEYAQGKLQEPIAPELANLHITRAEQYFDDLEEQQTYFNQECVTKKYGIERWREVHLDTMV